MKDHVTLALATASLFVATTVAGRMPPPPAPTVPAGTIVAYGGEAIPSGWLLCDGRALDKENAKYKALFAAILQSHGNGTTGAGASSVTDFNLPDYRGMFLRGVNGSRGLSVDDDARTAAAAGGKTKNAVGSVQQDQLRSTTATTHVTIPPHSHTFTVGHVDQSGYGDQALWREPGAGSTTHPGTSAAGGVDQDFTSQPFGGTETRPMNAYVNYIIKL